MATMVGTQKEIGKLLNSLLELDYDAVEAYKVAIEKLEDANDKAQLRLFMGDHERHVADLRALIATTGEKAAEGADLKAILTKGKVVLGSIVGDRAILMAMKSNEDDTNIAYERASKRDDIPPGVRQVLTRNLSDERRHRAYIEQRLAVTKGQSDAATHHR